MDNNLPVKFLWGVFCRRVITDRDTGEISMIDIMPALNLEQIVPIKIDDKIPEFSINLGKSYVTALIEKSDFDGHEINKELSIEFVQSGLKSVFVKTKKSEFLFIAIIGFLLFEMTNDLSLPCILKE